MKRLIKAIVYILLMVSLTSVVSSSTILKVEPMEKLVEKGDIFSVAIYSELDIAATGVAINYTFWDPSIATLKSITHGNFMEDAIAPGMGLSIDKNKGIIKYIVLLSLEEKLHSGNIAILEFEAINSGVFGLYIPEYCTAINGEYIKSNIEIHSYDFSNQTSVVQNVSQVVIEPEEVTEEVIEIEEIVEISETETTYIDYEDIETPQELPNSSSNITEAEISSKIIEDNSTILNFSSLRTVASFVLIIANIVLMVAIIMYYRKNRKNRKNNGEI